MKVKDSFHKEKPALSFEFFPPKTAEQENQLFETIASLKKFNPDFVSVTYGAGGSSAGKSFLMVGEIKKRFKIEPVAHLTCVGESEPGILQKLKILKNTGIINILALRGDLPEGYVPKSARFKFASDLVAFIKKEMPEYCLGVAGYPEMHPESKSAEADIEHLKQKVDAGADYIITQLFFENYRFFEFAEKCSQAGIRAPIIPGIMPIASLKQIKKMTSTCGASIPAQILSKLESFGRDQISVMKYGAEIAVKQCEELLKSGVRGIHFFVLNRTEPITQILDSIFPPPRSRES